MLSSLSAIDPSQLSQPLVSGKAGKVEEYARRGEILKASQEFESYFLSYLMKIMRETVPQGTLTANRMGETFMSFYDEELGKRAAQAGGFGLSQYMLASISDQEVAVKTSPAARSSTKLSSVP
ncbi:MAG: rod-binding protein [Nitrospirales bacterium]|nr:rod-binding protein [Nitrospirales bacterium]